ncbi:MAG: hypothetical protein ACLSBB_17925 [Ruthenibacterium lactatiformans]
MSNEKNLVPFTERTESEQRAIQQKGGIASGAARRRKRSLKEAADVYLSYLSQTAAAGISWRAAVSTPRISTIKWQ